MCSVWHLDLYDGESSKLRKRSRSWVVKCMPICTYTSQGAISLEINLTPLFFTHPTSNPLANVPASPSKHIQNLTTSTQLHHYKPISSSYYISCLDYSISLLTGLMISTFGSLQSILNIEVRVLLSKKKKSQTISHLCSKSSNISHFIQGECQSYHSDLWDPFHYSFSPPFISLVSSSISL